MNLKYIMISEYNSKPNFRSYTVWAHLYDILQKVKLYAQRAGQWVTRAGGGRKGGLQRDKRKFCGVIEAYILIVVVRAWLRELSKPHRTV